eukprot:scaffold1173_cov405-Prasinococcus_capsulatus_cf.AAC.25
MARAIAAAVHTLNRGRAGKMKRNSLCGRADSNATKPRPTTRKGRTRRSCSAPTNAKGNPASNAFGKADRKTTSSGHSSLCHMIESSASDMHAPLTALRPHGKSNFKQTFAAMPV